MTASKIGIVGAGSFGTALAHLACEAAEPRSVVLWGRDPEQINRLRVSRVNDAYLPDVPLAENIIPTHDITEVRDADVILVVPPSRGMREVARRIAAVNPRGAIVSCTKGIERGTGLRMSEILREALPGSPLAVLSGPSHAEELARGIPAAVVLGCEDESLAAALQRTLSTASLRIYTSPDIAGIELGGALKNVFALAAGVGDGLGFGDNTKAALVTRGVVEMVRLGVAMGGRPETFYGLSGMGDLMVTCFSRHSRNRAVGERLGRGERLEAIADSMQMIAEGVPTTASAYECARRFGLQTPIIDAVYGLIYEGKSPKEVLLEILSREPKAEGR